MDTESLAAEKARGQEEEAAGHIVSVFRKQKSGWLCYKASRPTSTRPTFYSKCPSIKGLATFQIQSKQTAEPVLKHMS